MDIHPIPGRAAHVPGAADGADAGGVRSGKTGSSLRTDRDQGPPSVDGGAADRLLEQARRQGIIDAGMRMMSMDPVPRNSNLDNEDETDDDLYQLTIGRYIRFGRLSDSSDRTLEPIKRYTQNLVDRFRKNNTSLKP